MTRRTLRMLAGPLATLALLATASPAFAASTYRITQTGSNSLEAVSLGGSLAVQVRPSPIAGRVEFSPAAVQYYFIFNPFFQFFVLPPGCDNYTAPGKTTCDANLLSGSLTMNAPVLEVDSDGISTGTLDLQGSDTSAATDSIVVEGGGTIGALRVKTRAGADSVIVRSNVGTLTVVGADTGDDRYVIDSGTVTGTLPLDQGNDVASSQSPGLVLNGGAGDDVLTGPGQLIGGPGADLLQPTVTSSSVSGDAGDDRLSFNRLAGPPRNLELTKLTATDVRVTGEAAVKTGIEHVEGGLGDDRLIGYAGADDLSGGEGNDTIEGLGGGDTLDGGSGENTVSYEHMTGAVTVDLGSGIGKAGAEDKLTSFRRVITGSGNDVVTGTAAREQFTLGDGDDQVNAGAGTDVIEGGPGNDLLRGGKSSDTVIGGPGRDTATYDERTHDEPLNVTLATPGGDGTPGENDTLLEIEDVVGGASNDSLTGDDGPNMLIGGPGSDTLDGLGGDDVLHGGDTRDALNGGPGHDELYGEGDDDSLNAYDGEADLVVCGDGGDDDALIDTIDTLDGCEYSRRGDLPAPVDADGDGVAAGFDCNDNNKAIRPGAVDVVGDGIDQDCDGFDQPVPYVDYGLEGSFVAPSGRGRQVFRLVVTGLSAGTKVQVSCKTTRKFRRRCPFTSSTRTASARTGKVDLTPLFRRRVLPPGTVIELRITSTGFNGRVRRFTIPAVGNVRDQRLCLPRGTKTPRRCPAGED